MTSLARALNVDEAWLAFGRSQEQTTKTARTGARGASGAVLTVAGALELEGFHVAFLDDEDADLTTIIGGRAVRISVVLGRPAVDEIEFTLPGKRPEHAVIGVMAAGFGATMMVPLKPADFAAKCGRVAASLPVKNLSRRRLKSIEQLELGQKA
jgi:hypothetical protein